jgi:carbon-monoxide dehydrogenase small subunit
MLLLTKELLEENPNPSDDEIKTALEGTLCRCTGYQSLIKAVKVAATHISSAKN